MVDHLEPVRLVHGLAALDADHDVLGLGVLGVHVVDVIRGDHRHTGPPAHFADPLVHAGLLGDPVRHQLEVVVVLTEDLGVLEGDGTGGVEALILDRSRDLALEARRERDEALVLLAQELLVHPRPVVVPLEVGARDERHEVLVTREVLGQEDEMERLAVALHLRVAVVPRAASDVRLDADDGLDASRLRGGVEVDRTIERAVIGDGQGGHVQRLRARHEVAQAREPVEQAVLTVGVEVDELLGDAGPFPAVGKHGASVKCIRLTGRSA